jgi:predicted XRE-type DNA-binding protein
MKMHDRFWAKVERGEPGQCWHWRAARSGGRTARCYGYFRMDSRRMEYAHRVAYELHHGPIATGEVIRHKCDNPLCCNPAHLQRGSQADNVRDMMQRGRNCRGEASSKAVLTEAAVIEIRQLLAAGQLHREIASRFGVCRATVSQIARGRTWAWL